MEHREEMNCGGDLCKEMLELDKLLRASDSEEMMGGTLSAVVMSKYFIVVSICSCPSRNANRNI